MEWKPQWCRASAALVCDGPSGLLSWAQAPHPCSHSPGQFVFWHLSWPLLTPLSLKWMAMTAAPHDHTNTINPSGHTEGEREAARTAPRPQQWRAGLGSLALESNPHEDLHSAGHLTHSHCRSHHPVRVFLLMFKSTKKKWWDKDPWRRSLRGLNAEI